MLRGRGCYNWITHCVTNHSAGNHSDCGFNLTWSFPSHRMTQPSAAGQAAVAWGWGMHPTPSLPAWAWLGRGPWDISTGPFAISVLVAFWTGVGRLGGWPQGRQDQELVVGTAKTSSSRSEIGAFPRGRDQAWPRDNAIALHLCVWMWLVTSVLAAEVASDCPPLALVHLFLARGKQLDYGW